MSFAQDKQKFRIMDHLEDEGSEAKVLIIYTGGTIGMMRNENDGKKFIVTILQKDQSVTTN